MCQARGGTRGTRRDRGVANGALVEQGAARVRVFVRGRSRAKTLGTEWYGNIPLDSSGQASTKALKTSRFVRWCYMAVDEFTVLSRL
jgi:hypothetical protein